MSSETLLLTLASLIKNHRTAEGISQESAAKRFGISTGTYKSLEKGAPSVAIGTYLTVLEAMGQLDKIEAAVKPKRSLFDAWPTATAA